MTAKVQSVLPQIIQKQEAAILADWIREQLAAGTKRTELISENDLRSQSKEFFSIFTDGLQGGDLDSIQSGNWQQVRAFLADLSRSRALQGFSPGETATFIFSLKQAIAPRVGDELANDAKRLQNELWLVNSLLDKFGLYTIETFIKSREEIIERQREEMLELSTPVVKLWDGILALPMIGTLDSSRTQIVMESLLQKIVETGSDVAIIDITGVPTVDTLVAQHLLKTVTAARLMGADCIISGIRPQIAATIVHLGIDLSHVITKASLADAFALALKRVGRSVTNGLGAPVGTPAVGQPIPTRSAHQTPLIRPQMSL